MFYNEFLIFMSLSLNVYLYNMHMGVKKKKFCACDENDCKKNVSDTVYAVLTHEEIVA